MTIPHLLRAALAVLGLAGPAPACELALAMAVDVSGSVDEREFRLQMTGLAEALRDPLISEALVRAEARLMLVQWTGTGRQRVTQPWASVTDFDALDAFAARVEQDQRIWRNFSTAIGEALAVTAAAFPDPPDCARRVIDISGDGFSNEGPVPETVRPLLDAAGITVNALAIEGSEAALTDYFREAVIHGPGAFVETAASHTDYPAAIRRKLAREVVLQTAAAQDRTRRLAGGAGPAAASQPLVE